MAKKEIDHEEPPLQGRDILLLFATFAGPLAWGLHLQVSYSLAPTACDFQSKLFLHLVTLAAFLIVAAGGAVAWRIWKKLPEGSTAQGGLSASRARFMAIAGVSLNALFGLVILAQEVPVLILKVCD